MVKVRMKLNMVKSSGTQEEKDKLRDDLLTLKDISHRLEKLWGDWDIPEEGGEEK